jgi:hypothetical protein
MSKNPVNYVSSSAALSEALWNAVCWRLDRSRIGAGNRREGFPTWSWLGVEGRIAVNTYAGNRSPGSEEQTFGFEVETDDGDMVGWCKFVRTGGLERSPLSWGSRLRIQ